MTTMMTSWMMTIWTMIPDFFPAGSRRGIFAFDWLKRGRDTLAAAFLGILSVIKSFQAIGKKMAWKHVKLGVGRR